MTEVAPAPVEAQQRTTTASTVKSEAVTEVAPAPVEAQQRTTTASSVKSEEVADVASVPVEAQQRTTTASSVKSEEVADVAPAPVEAQQRTTTASSVKSEEVADVAPAAQQRTTTASSVKSEEVADVASVPVEAQQRTTTASSVKSEEVADVAPAPVEAQQRTTTASSVKSEEVADVAPAPVEAQQRTTTASSVKSEEVAEAQQRTTTSNVGDEEEEPCYDDGFESVEAADDIRDHVAKDFVSSMMLGESARPSSATLRPEEDVDQKDELQVSPSPHRDQSSEAAQEPEAVAASDHREDHFPINPAQAESVALSEETVEKQGSPDGVYDDDFKSSSTEEVVYDDDFAEDVDAETTDFAQQLGAALREHNSGRDNVSQVRKGDAVVLPPFEDLLERRPDAPSRPSRTGKRPDPPPAVADSSRPTSRPATDQRSRGSARQDTWVSDVSDKDVSGKESDENPVEVRRLSSRAKPAQHTPSQQPVFRAEEDFRSHLGEFVAVEEEVTFPGARAPVSDNNNETKKKKKKKHMKTFDF